jgi:hypothetical protein
MLQEIREAPRILFLPGKRFDDRERGIDAQKAAMTGERLMTTQHRRIF